MWNKVYINKKNNQDYCDIFRFVLFRAIDHSESQRSPFHQRLTKNLLVRFFLAYNILFAVEFNDFFWFKKVSATTWIDSVMPVGCEDNVSYWILNMQLNCLLNTPLVGRFFFPKLFGRTKCNSIFVLVQNNWTGTKHFWTCRDKAYFFYVSRTFALSKKSWNFIKKTLSNCSIIKNFFVLEKT